MTYQKHRNDRMPPVAVLRERVAYDPATGALTWRHCGPEHFKNHLGWRIWHGKFAGKPVMKRRRGYIVVTISHAGREIHCQGHRVAWALMTGAWPEHEVDHEDRDHSNNRWKNLRPATHQQNQWNRTANRNSKTGVRGVYPNGSGKFVAQVAVDQKPVHVGTYTTLAEAAVAQRAAALALGRGSHLPSL